MKAKSLHLADVDPEHFDEVVENKLRATYTGSGMNDGQVTEAIRNLSFLVIDSISCF
jgi:muramidase (phage lysozyme)